MSEFKRNNNSSLTGTIDLVNGNSLRLKINGISEGAKARHLIISSSCPLINIEQNPDERKIEQIVTVRVQEVGSACLASIRAIDPKNQMEVASIRINVLPKITLPDIESDQGMVARLLLAEALSPSRKNLYGDGEDVLRSMDMIRQVLDNRLIAAKTSAALRSYVVCNPVRDDLKSIVLADQCGSRTAVQFEGFSSRGIDTNILKNINSMLDNANNGSHNDFKNFRRHVSKAIKIGMRPFNPSPMSDTALLYWRTTGSGKPTPYATLRHSIGNQEFYSLRKSYLENPMNPEKD